MNEPTRADPETAASPPSDGRFDALKERAKVVAPYIAYGAFFTLALFLFAYLTFPYDRIRDRIVADFEHNQKAAPGASRQTLSIGEIRPSWFTGIVVKDLALTTVPSDPTKAPSTIVLDEVRVRVSLGSLFSPMKDVSFQIKALGGTLEGTITHTKSTESDPAANAKKPVADPKKPVGPAYDRTVKAEFEGLDMNLIGPLRDAMTVPVGGTLRGKVDLTLVAARPDRASGSIEFDIDNFWVSDGKVPFKVPALKMFFGSEDITLPQILVGSVPVQITVKAGVAKIDKMSAAGKDLDLLVDGQIALREQLGDSDVGVGIRFKFNDTYRKKGDATAGLLLALDSEPKLRAGKRADGFYGLRVMGPLSGNLQILPNPQSGSTPGAAPQPAAPR